MPSSVEILLQRISDLSETSVQRCIASEISVQVSMALVETSRDRIARTKDQLARVPRCPDVLGRSDR